MEGKHATGANSFNIAEQITIICMVRERQGRVNLKTVNCAGTHRPASQCCRSRTVKQSQSSGSIDCRGTDDDVPPCGLRLEVDVRRKNHTKVL